MLTIHNAIRHKSGPRRLRVPRRAFDESRTLFPAGNNYFSKVIILVILNPVPRMT